MIYLDNAATTLKKPRSVSGAVCKWVECGNPGRGSHRISLSASEVIYNTRKEAAALFNAAEENIVFTSNATSALNFAIKGLIPHGATVITSDFEHNSVRRPVLSLCRTKDCKRKMFQSDGGDITLRELKNYAGDGVCSVVCIHKSNITGRSLPIGEIGRFCRENGILFILDASQSAGNSYIDMERDNIDVLCCAGHKGLMGPQGTGLLIFGRNIDIEPLMEGGSGSDSRDEQMPVMLPDRLEAGTLATPAIAGLGEGIRFIRRIGAENIGIRERYLWNRCRNMLDSRRIRVYDDGIPGANFLFNIEGMLPSQVARELDKRGICVRAGLHCAPEAHNALATGEAGAVRASFSYFTTEWEIDAFAEEVLKLK